MKRNGEAKTGLVVAREESPCSVIKLKALVIDFEARKVKSARVCTVVFGR